MGEQPPRPGSVNGTKQASVCCAKPEKPQCPWLGDSEQRRRDPSPSAGRALRLASLRGEPASPGDGLPVLPSKSPCPLSLAVAQSHRRRKNKLASPRQREGRGAAPRGAASRSGTRG